MKYNLNWLQEKSKKEKLEFEFFWSDKDKKGEGIGKFCFSQWYASPIVVNELTYPTAEHWMMSKKALKFNDVNSHELVLETSTPRAAKKIGRNIKGYDNDQWYLPSYAVVVVGNIHKFNQHPDLLDSLLGTKNKVLVEASPYDNKWGIGLRETDEDAVKVKDWKGTNFLGFALMEVRDFFMSKGRFEYPNFSMIPPSDHFSNYDSKSEFWLSKNARDYVVRFNEFYDGLSTHERTIYDYCYPYR